MLKAATFAATVLVLATPALAGCNYGTSQAPRENPVKPDPFGYDGLNGPLNWVSLNATANQKCGTGSNQSPINLNSSISTLSGGNISMQIDTYPNGSIFENLGATVEVISNGTLLAGGANYSLAQFHFHTPSEHRVNLMYFPMEMHMVFESKDGVTSVLALFVELGEYDDHLLKSVFTYIESIAVPGNVTKTGPLDFTSLENHVMSNDLFSYNGSLTTPPCSESVPWYISKKPLHVTPRTYERVKKVLGLNARYTQNQPGGINLLLNNAIALQNLGLIPAS